MDYHAAEWAVSEDLLGPKKRVADIEAILDRHVQSRRAGRAEPDITLDATDVTRGVTVGWLSQVFRMDPHTVKKRLADCVPLERRKNGYIYDIRMASAFLVKPVFDVVRYLNNMKPSDLPAQLQKEFWDGQLKRQLWEERAGDLWRTSKVLEVFSDTFLRMKSVIQLWSEDVEREVGLTIEQRAVIVRLTDELQNDIQKKLLQMRAVSTTRPMTDEVVIESVMRAEHEEEEDLVG